MTDSAFSEWFEKLWIDREDRVYRSLFGDLGEGVYTAGEAVYQRFERGQPHPGWFNHGVFACPPHEERDSWIYVTSGLSNPWNLERPGKDPSGFAGVGFELVVESHEESGWAVPLLHNLMAYELLVAVGTYQDAELFEYGNRVPLNASITTDFESQLRWLLIEQPKHYPSSFELAAGRVDFFHLVGASDAEVEFARKNSQDNLLQLLRDKDVHPFTDASRPSVL
jgi:hypothetical protein